MPDDAIDAELAPSPTTDPDGLSECSECGAMACRVTDIPRDYIVTYECSACGHDGWDSYADLYGCMSVPWGYLL